MANQQDGQWVTIRGHHVFIDNSAARGEHEKATGFLSKALGTNRTGGKKSPEVVGDTGGWNDKGKLVSSFNGKADVDSTHTALMKSGFEIASNQGVYLHPETPNTTYSMYFGGGSARHSIRVKTDVGAFDTATVSAPLAPRIGPSRVYNPSRRFYDGSSRE